LGPPAQVFLQRSILFLPLPSSSTANPVRCTDPYILIGVLDLSNSKLLFILISSSSEAPTDYPTISTACSLFSIIVFLSSESSIIGTSSDSGFVCSGSGFIVLFVALFYVGSGFYCVSLDIGDSGF